VFSSFQPVVSAAVALQDTAKRHEAAVQERVRVLLNLPASVPVPGAKGVTAVAKERVPAHEKASKLTERSRDDAKQQRGRGNAHARKRCANDANMDVDARARGRGAADEAEYAVKQVEVNPHSVTAKSAAPDNVGLGLLQKFGWQEGVALGKHGGTATAPIEVHKKSDNAGIGAEQFRSHLAGGQWSIDDSADSDKAKAWKRMMARYNEDR
jgi:hypothetical protein